MVAGEVAPPCLDVTLALRYMTYDSRITFHQVIHEHRLEAALLTEATTSGIQYQMVAVHACAAAAAVAAAWVVPAGMS